MALTATELGCAKSSFEPSIILVTVQLAQTGQVYAAMWKVLFPRHLTTSCSGTREGGIKDKALYAPAQVLT